MAAAGIWCGKCLGFCKEQRLAFQMRPFILFCAGEDSGDILGEKFVRNFCKEFDAVGVGGHRMQKAGLVSVVPFDDLPVNGFGDVFKHSFRLSRHLKTLESLLLRENCKGLVAVDYPGFNLKLMQRALDLGKRVVYVEPPQIWAWKPHRVKYFLSPRAKKTVELYSCYDVEIEAYKKYGISVQKIEHPFEKFRCGQIATEQNVSGIVLLYPGSRESQMKRNFCLYKKIARKLKQKKVEVRFVASRKIIQSFLNEKLCGEFSVLLSPRTAEERFSLMRTAACIICGPGSVTAEAHLANTPCVAASRIEPLTYFLGKAFLRTRYLCMPNIEADFCGQKPLIPEFVKVSFSNLELHAEQVLTEVEKFVSFKLCF